MSCFNCKYLEKMWNKSFDDYEEPCVSCMREDGWTSDKPPKSILYYNRAYRPYWRRRRS